jgi:uncharacterized protein
MTEASEGTVSPILEALYAGDGTRAAELGAQAPELDVFEAAALGRVDRLRELLDAEPTAVSAWSPDGFMPLHLAAFFGHSEACELLLERGADPSLISRHEFVKVTPLHSAVAREGAADLDTARVLVEHGAPVNAGVEGGHTPLHSAAANGDRGAVELLLANGADAHAERDDGKTAADLARESGHEEVAELVS